MNGEHASRIKQLLTSRFGLGLRPEEISDRMPIFGAGLGLDSMAAIELVVALEEEFGIAFRDQDMVEANFQSVRALADYIRSRLGAGDGS